MSDIKEQFKKDFNDSTNSDLSFNLEQLEPNTKKNRHKIKPYKIAIIATSICLASLVLVVCIPLLAAMTDIETKPKLYVKKYSANEIAIAESNSFRKLNAFNYPNLEWPFANNLSQEEKVAYDNFSNLTYHSLVNASKNDNMSYCVIGLYSILNELSKASSTEVLKAKFDSLLGLNEQNRIQFYNKVINANSYSTDNSSVQLKNAAFFTNAYNYSSEYVNYLTKLYCEAYQLDFSKDVNKMVEWVNEAVNQNNFIDEEFIEADESSVLYLFSTLYFKNAWNNKYLSSNNVKDKFYLSGGDSVDVTYMKHSYMDYCYYDYDKYISVQDTYNAGTASITYLVPKSTSDNIYDLTKDVNIFEEKEENKIVPNDEYGAIVFNLKTPKFNLKCDVDFKECVTDLGFGDIFDWRIDSFANAFDDEKLDDKNIFVDKLKQRNEIEFNEDGTIVKSVTMSGLAAGSAAPMENNTLDVNLDQPFIYIIRDKNKTPIFVGHVDNPTKN